MLPMLLIMESTGQPTRGNRRAVRRRQEGERRPPVSARGRCRPVVGRVLGAVLVVCTGILAAPEAGAVARFQSTPVTTASEGQPYVYHVVATGVGQVVVSAPNGLPSWLTLTRTGNGTYDLHGTPGAGDSGQGIVLRAADSDNSFICRLFRVNCTDTQAFDIDITRNQPPVVVPPGIPDQQATQGTPFSLDVSVHFTDPDGDALTFSASGLPPSLSISAAGLISGTPTTADVRPTPIEVTVTARDPRNAQVSDSFQLFVQATARADIAVESIVVQPAAALVNETVEWAFTVRNRGPNDGGAIELDVKLAGTPLFLTNNPCTLTESGDRTALTCAVAPLPAGDSTTVRLTGSASQAGDVFVTAVARATQAVPHDPNPANNSAATSASIAEELGTDAAQSMSGTINIGTAAGDLNADGYDDLAIVTIHGEPAGVMLNVADPTALHNALKGPGDSRRGLSSPPLPFGGAAPGHAIALLDFNNDGHLDIATANGPGVANELFVNGGGATFNAFLTLGAAADDSRAIAAGDLTGNGFPDLVFANVGPSRVYLNDGAGQFAPAPSLGDSANRYGRDVLIAPLLGSALPDVVLAVGDGPALLYRNLGGGNFDGPVVIDPGPTSSVAAGDFNGICLIDLVFGRDVPGPAGLPSNPVYLNDGMGGFQLAAELGAAETVDVLTADLTGNGVLDLIFINAGGTHQVYAGTGNGQFSLRPRQFVSLDAASAAVGRFSRDLRLGVAVSGLHGTEVFFNDGFGNLGLGVTMRPVIELIGSPQIVLMAGSTYEDPGAVAVDALGQEFPPAVSNPVNPSVVGTYVVTYTAMDSAGNAAAPVTRTVRVEARDQASGGGGSAIDYVTILLLLTALMMRAGIRRRRVKRT
jgi:hypothetical protein